MAATNKAKNKEGMQQNESYLYPQKNAKQESLFYITFEISNFIQNL